MKLGGLLGRLNPGSRSDQASALAKSGRPGPTIRTTVPRDGLEIRMECVFEFPRDRVFAAFTDPAILPRWWGAIRIEQMDLQPGGQWRWIETHSNGKTSTFSGIYREVVPQERIVQTFESSWAPGLVYVQTHVFEEFGEHTTLVTTLDFGTTADRDVVFAQGPQVRASAKYWQLDVLLAKQPRA